MDTNEIRSRIVVSDEKLERIKAKYHQRAENIVESFQLFFVALARLAYTAGDFDDFDLVGMSINAADNSFLGSLVQIVRDSCNTFTNFRYTENMKLMCQEITSTIRSLIECVDYSKRSKLIDEIGHCILKCIEYGKKIENSFNSVLALVAEEYVRYVLTKLTTKDQIIESLDAVRKQLKSIVELWDFVPHFTRARAIIRDIDELSTSQSVDALPNMAKQITKLYISNKFIYSLIYTYFSYDHGGNAVKFVELSQNLKKNKHRFMELATICLPSEDDKKVIGKDTAAFGVNIRAFRRMKKD